MNFSRVETMSHAVGLRVVRGPDWKKGNQDGGEGQVGTVIRIGKSGIKKRITVQWDSGKRADYRAGHRGKYDLRVFDNASIGVRHVHITCDACKERSIFGIRWKCKQCEDYDLCTTCYMNQEHDLEHEFIRTETVSSTGVEVSSRLNEKYVSAKGIFKGSQIVRGHDWEWGDQDGSSKSKSGLLHRMLTKPETKNVGTVISLQGWTKEWQRNAVKVLWPSGNEYLYRLGYDGKVDVKCVQDSSGGFYYPNHLPVLGTSSTQQSNKQHKQTNNIKQESKLCIGDKVKMKTNIEELKALQENHGGWNPDMENSINEIGTIKCVFDTGDVEVQFGENFPWNFNPLALIKVCGSDSDNDSDNSDDDDDETIANFLQAVQVALLSGIGRIQLQVSENEAVEESSETTDKLVVAAAQGRKGIVTEILKEAPDNVNKKCKGKTALQLASHEGYAEIVELLLSSNADPNIADGDGDTAIHYSVIGNRAEILELLLIHGANIDATNKKKISALHIAVNKGYKACLAILLKHKCNVNIQDRSGETALHDAIKLGCTDVISDLINHPEIDLSIRNKNGFNILHLAAIIGNNLAMEKLLEKTCQFVNLKKDDGYAALHIACINGHAHIARTLLAMGQCDINIRTHSDLTPLMLATHHGYCSVIDVLLRNGVEVNAEDEDGDTALHLALIKYSQGQKPNQKDDYPAAIETILNDFVQRQIQRDVYLAIACYLAQKKADLQHMNNKQNTPLSLLKDIQDKSLLKEYSIKSNEISDQLLESKVEENVKECIICNELPASIKFHPCQHQIACPDCSLRMKKCVTCEEVIMVKITSNGNVLDGIPKMESTERVQYLENKIQQIELAQTCPICMDHVREVVFLCGHGSCNKCVRKLDTCHVCRKPIEKKIDLY